MSVFIGDIKFSSKISDRFITTINKRFTETIDKLPRQRGSYDLPAFDRDDLYAL